MNWTSVIVVWNDPKYGTGWDNCQVLGDVEQAEDFILDYLLENEIKEFSVFYANGAETETSVKIL